jgi:hypothetical protein
MKHLTPDELIDAIDNALSRGRQAHVSGCDECRAQLAQMRAMLSEVSRVDVPEPSPLFWERFSDRVRTAIAGEPALPPRAGRWFQWQVLVPIGALAALVLALASAVPERAISVVDRAELAMFETGSDNQAVSDVDAQWELVAALVGDVDFDAAAEAGVAAAPGAADDVVMLLSAAEQQELMRLLREELERSGG